MEVLQQQLLISEDKIVTPLVEVLNETISKSPTPDVPLEISPSFAESLDNLFPEQKYLDKNIQMTKKILGPLVDSFTEGNLKDMIVEIQYLTESWLDDLERQIFNGKTLNGLLHEKGGV